tara:strand:- start:1341 stop:2078 length:738 start_codon:yes stop_codon:yes gene_type:complete
LSLPKNGIAIGGGSNVIVDPNINAPLIKVSSKYRPFEVQDHVLTCSAGASVSQILKWMLSNHYSGLEFAAGVPATIGGMAYMNFECWGNEVSKLIESVYIFEQDKGFRWIDRKDYDVAYRWSSFHDLKCIILAVKLKLTPAVSDDVKANIVANLNERKAKQPVLKSTFGSVFKNPLPKKAGQLIDNINLKGVKIGDAMISNHHANFFENLNAANFSDTLALIKFVQNEVLKMYNINLECEVQIIQ